MLLVLLLGASAAYPCDLSLPFSRYRLPELSGLNADEDAPGVSSAAIEGGAVEDGGTGAGKKVAGAVMFGSGVLLCTWGIVDWETDDTQCCPAGNTENVAKIVVGVVLINAGLVYLIAGGL